MSPHEAMLAIQEMMNAEEWSPDTLDGIAEVLNEAGYPVRDQVDDLEQPEIYEVGTWFFMRLPGTDDDGGVERHTPAGSLVCIDQTFEGGDNYSVVCPANGAGFFMKAAEIRTDLMPVPTVYDLSLIHI